MKLSARTINILKNFSTINPSIVLKPGNTIATISTNKTIMARATCPDEFTNVIAIYNLARFISTMTLFDDPDLEFGTNAVQISSGKKSNTYHYADPSVILAPPEKEIKLPSVDVDCFLTNKDIQDVTKAMNVLGLPELAVVGDGSNIMLQAVDVKNPSADEYSIVVAETDKVFRAVFRSENLKLMDGDYQLMISSKGISQFVGTEASYWIAVEASSTF